MEMDQLLRVGDSIRHKWVYVNHLNIYSKTCVKRPTIGFQYQLALNAGQRYCRMLQVEHFAILSTFITLVLGHFGHGHFGLGCFGLDISATDVSATENAEGGRFGHNQGCVHE